MKKYSVGEPITGWPVDTWNRLVDSLENNIDMIKLGSFIRDSLSQYHSLQHACVINVVNKSEYDVHEFDVLGIDNSAMTPPTIGVDDSANEVILGGVQIEGVEPNRSDHADAFVITLEPIAENGTGRAVIVGVTWARVDITDANHNQATIDDADSTQLTSVSSNGVQIIWKPSGTGAKWCIVNLGFRASGVYLGRAITAITAADWDANPPTLGFGTVQPYDLGTAPALSCPGATPAPETWYNMAPQEINLYAGLVAIDWQGIKLIIVETCVLIETTGCDT